MTKELECLIKDTPSWYAGMRTRVEARVTLEQVKELWRGQEELWASASASFSYPETGPGISLPSELRGWLLRVSSDARFVV